VFLSYLWEKTYLKRRKNLMNCDNMVEAVVLVNTEFESPQGQVIQNLKEINSVNKPYTTAYGVYDFVAKVQTKTVAELKSNVLERIRKIDSVMSTTTLVAAENSSESEKNEC
jgi:DNA-binding Lrp family transcriptional regulator